MNRLNSSLIQNSIVAACSILFFSPAVGSADSKVLTGDFAKQVNKDIAALKIIYKTNCVDLSFLTEIRESNDSFTRQQRELLCNADLWRHKAVSLVDNAYIQYGGDDQDFRAKGSLESLKTFTNPAEDLSSRLNPLQQMKTMQPISNSGDPAKSNNLETLKGYSTIGK